jgi:hypothetical protein
MVNMVAFTGHRHWKYSDVKAFLDEIVKKYGKDAVWICGGAVGLDSHAALYAMENGIRLWLVLPFSPVVMSKRWNSGVRLKVFDLSLLSENIFFYNFNNLFIP